METINKTLNFEIKQVGEEGDRTLRFVGSDETPDRDNDIIEVAGWRLDEYLKNPVFLWAHRYDEPPIGKAVNVTIDASSKKLIFDIKFPTAEEYPFADTIYKLYRGSYLNATSVGFKGVKFKTRDDESVLELSEWQRGKRYMQQELLELSAVPVPSNPNALQTVRSKGFKDEHIDKVFVENKTVVPYKSYPTEPDTAAWDGPAEIAAADVDDLKIMCTWYDTENADTKQAYKLPHHRQSDYHLIWRGVTAAMGALLGARGGANIPEADRQRCYNHLAKHYTDDFDKEPPEFKDYSEVELKEMFPEDTKNPGAKPEIKRPDLDGNPSVWDIMDAIRIVMNPAEMHQMGGPWISDLYPVNYPSGHVIIEKQDKYYLYQYEYVDGKVTMSTDYTELEEVYQPKSFNFLKAGATLSSKNREMLNDIQSNIAGCSDRLRKFIDTSGTMNEEGEPPDKGIPPNNEIAELKQALDEIKNQVLLLSQKNDLSDASKVEIDLDAIDAKSFFETDEPEIEPDMLKQLITESVENLVNASIREILKNKTGGM
jgi:hypothetical protein